MYILFIYIRIYDLNYFVFMLLVYLLHKWCGILTLKNVEYQFNTKYSNTTITLC